MASTLSDLAGALRERLEIIGDEISRRDPAQHMLRLQKSSERLDEIERDLPTKINPQLRHFLERRSYGKALEQIEALGV